MPAPDSTMREGVFQMRARLRPDSGWAEDDSHALETGTDDHFPVPVSRRANCGQLSRNPEPVLIWMLSPAEDCCSGEPTPYKPSN